jgi:uncharacterized damage-inducible protein DinB
MIPMLRSLIAHQEWADETMLSAIGNHPGSAGDDLMRTTLHHIVVTQRAFLSLFLQRPFDVQQEMRVPGSLDELADRFRETHAEEAGFVSNLEDSDLARVLPMPWIEGARPTVAEALMQVVMHSQHHRGQCASRLRALGGNPPMVDYILWIRDRDRPV